MGSNCFINCARYPEECKDCEASEIESVSVQIKTIRKCHNYGHSVDHFEKLDPKYDLIVRCKNLIERDLLINKIGILKGVSVIKTGVFTRKGEKSEQKG